MPLRLHFLEDATGPITSSKKELRTLAFAAFSAALVLPLEIDVMSSQLVFRSGRFGGPMHGLEEEEDSEEDDDR